MDKIVFDRIKHIATPEGELKKGDWVYTPNRVFGTSPANEEHNIFQYDDRINYSLHFGHELIFFKINPYQVKK